MRAASLPSRPGKVIPWPPAKVITWEPTWTATSRFRLTVAPTFRSKKFSELDGEPAVGGEVDDPTPTWSTIASGGVVRIEDLLDPSGEIIWPAWRSRATGFGGMEDDVLINVTTIQTTMQMPRLQEKRTVQFRLLSAVRPRVCRVRVETLPERCVGTHQSWWCLISAEIAEKFRRGTAKFHQLVFLA